MIKRATTADFINKVVNHPAVRPSIHAAPGPVDLSAVVANPSHVVMEDMYGCMMFFQHVPGLYEIHTMILPEGRGAWAMDFAQQAVEYLFLRTNATEVFTRVPEGNIGAGALARACGAKHEHRTKQQFPDREFPVEIMGGRIQDWVRFAPGLIERGQEFHCRLEEKCRAAGIPVKHHEQNDWHDRHVGVAAGMVLGGQPVKAVVFYNRWAAMALAPPLNVVSAEPLVLDIHDCRLEIQGDDFKVIPCQ